MDAIWGGSLLSEGYGGLIETHNHADDDRLKCALSPGSVLFTIFNIMTNPEGRLSLERKRLKNKAAARVPQTPDVRCHCLKDSLVVIGPIIALRIVVEQPCVRWLVPHRLPLTFNEPHVQRYLQYLHCTRRYCTQVHDAKVNCAFKLSSCGAPRRFCYC